MAKGYQTQDLKQKLVEVLSNTTKLMTEVILPTIESVQELFEQGKISKSEEKLLGQIISSSIQMLNLITREINPRKNVIIISADSKSALIAESASASFHSEGWNVSSLGDMSDAINVIFDLDLQQFLGKVWTKKMQVRVFSIVYQTNAVSRPSMQGGNSVKEKFGKN